jgi:hypothetical protein
MQRFPAVSCCRYPQARTNASSILGTGTRIRYRPHGPIPDGHALRGLVGLPQTSRPRLRPVLSEPT